ncbi:hypothetical protein GIB67_002525 [Kingdonia uniflora]|uniref:RING-CH-type domain-containing protein n=1 Tax=Kingdonia uniflora TaxID=39325 RepID=A0A7J7N937_9MAGN|nr:hypothetical protein GIB67_002525 [Kingdonia uniflora]
MGDHFVLLVDRLLTESTLEAAIESRNQSQQTTPLSLEQDMKTDFSSHKINGLSSGILLECRICQDEDEEFNMETPCSCCGSLKYAHRRCVQRWCNEKGDTTCEICHQPFKPGYTAPPKLYHYGAIPMNFRGNWAVSRRDNARIIAMVATDHNFPVPDYDDFTAPTTRSIICCRTVAIIFMVLLFLRHTLPIIISGDEEYSFPLLMLLLLRTTGILVPIYIMAKAFAAIQRRRRQQEPHILVDTSFEEENEQIHPQPPPHLIRVH